MIIATKIDFRSIWYGNHYQNSSIRVRCNLFSGRVSQEFFHKSNQINYFFFFVSFFSWISLRNSLQIRFKFRNVYAETHVWLQFGHRFTFQSRITNFPILAFWWIYKMNLILFHDKQDHYAILSISNEWCMVYQSMEEFRTRVSNSLTSLNLRRQKSDRIKFSLKSTYRKERTLELSVYGSVKLKIIIIKKNWNRKRDGEELT